MTFDPLSELNWIAVVVAALVYFALGALWYAPFAFGKPWQRALGWDEASQGGGMSGVTYAAPLVFALASSIATAMLARATGSDDVGSGLTLGVVVGVGYVLALTAYEAVFDPTRPSGWTVWMISGVYHFVAILIVSVIVSAWR